MRCANAGTDVALVTGPDRGHFRGTGWAGEPCEPDDLINANVDFGTVNVPNVALGTSTAPVARSYT